MITVKDFKPTGRCFECGHSLDHRRSQAKWCEEERGERHRKRFARRLKKDQGVRPSTQPLDQSVILPEPAHEDREVSDLFLPLRRDWEMACITGLPNHSKPEQEAAYRIAKAAAQARLQANGYGGSIAGCEGFTSPVADFSETGPQDARPSGYRGTAAKAQVFG